MSTSVLLVDDRDSTAASLAGVLEEAGYEVTVASSGADALDRLDGKAYDVMLTDLNLQGMDGLMLLRYAAKEYPRMAGIVMTGMPNVGTMVEAATQGAAAYLIKPFEASRLFLSIEEAIKWTRVCRELRVLTEHGSPAPAC